MLSRLKNFSPQIWSGIECSINRIGDSYNDQLTHSLHYQFPEDLQEFISLGIAAIRYPVLWELHEPVKDKPIDWSWSTHQLNTICDAGIEPIIGLLHHGSGPSFTNLEDDSFPELFSNYASKVARQFPRVKYYTLINEPLTTARFSGMYGHWYPHKKSDGSFIRMFLNEMKAIILAMQALKEINPEIQFIQTEDIGQTLSTPLLQYQADFENARRWLTFDILSGRFQKDHPLHSYFLWAGIKPSELSFFYDAFCPPDILGVNYYITSERYLDEKLSLYPEQFHGGNHKHAYADVEAIRVRHDQKSGIGTLLTQIKDRYKIPVAITEVHMHCHREHQLRWLMEIYNECIDFNSHGGNVVAIAPWALLGSFGWNELLKNAGGDYECGVFDLRSEQRLRKTALTACISSLSENKKYNHPVLTEKGWWHQQNRFYNASSIPCGKKGTQGASLLIIGRNGTLAKAFARICDQRFINYQVAGSEKVDIRDQTQVERIIQTYQPWAVINAAGYVNVDAAESASEICFQCNAFGAENLARACANNNIKLISFSSDLIFDGNTNNPYLENDIPNPINVYGKSKALSEKLVLNASHDALIIRTSSFFSAWDPYNFAKQVLSKAQMGKTIPVMDDVHISPTYVPDLVHAALDLLIDGESGIWHLVNDGELSWSDFAMEICDRGGIESKLIHSQPQKSLHLSAARPAYSVLGGKKAGILRPLHAALDSFFAEYKAG